MAKAITRKNLENLRANQQKSYYGSQAKAMFVDGIFNSDNWNGGDGLIRQYFYNCDNQIAKEVSCKYEELEFSGDIIINYQCFNDQSYATIILVGALYFDEFETEIEDVAYFTWYKSRGKTENAKYNGKHMTEEDYLLVLNALQGTGFEFELQ